jgi:hypothetical protein
MAGSIHPWPERLGNLMIQVDNGLLLEARQLIGRANVHHLKKLILVYEQSVALHNRDWPGHKVYRAVHELRLKRYVLDCRFEDLRQLAVDARDCARRGCARSAVIVAGYDRLEEMLEADKWKPTAKTKALRKNQPASGIEAARNAAVSDL